MSQEGHIASPPSSGALLQIIAATIAAAAVALVMFVLPAEYGIDLTGYGKAAGLTKLSAEVTPAAESAPKTATYSEKALQKHVIEITMPPNDELEYKVRLKTGETMIYSWTASIKNPEEFYFDFHGETPQPEGAPPIVKEYKQATGAKSAGGFTAPMDGVHGWYFQNQSVDTIKVRLELAGFYELVPPGEYGNDRGIEPLK
jgi:hypothetical protein